MSTFSAPPAVNESSSAKLYFLPLSPEIVDQTIGSLHRDSRHMLALIENVRLHEPADRLFVNVVAHDNNWVERWHQTNGDVPSDSVFYYRLGLLYGLDIAQSARRQVFATRDLTVAGPRAFAAAMQDMGETYRGLNDSISGWQRQKARELRYAGSDVLTLATASLEYRMQQHRRTDGLPETSEDDASSMHVGLVDGAIFVAAYAQRRANKKLAVFTDPISYVPTYDVRRHAIGHGSDSFWSPSRLTVQHIVETSLLHNSLPAYVYSDGVAEMTIKDLLVQVSLRQCAVAGEVCMTPEQRRNPLGLVASKITTSILSKHLLQKPASLA